MPRPFHQRTLDLLGHPAGRLDDPDLLRFEHAARLILPAAFAEWYRIPGWIDLLRRFLDSDPLAPGEFRIEEQAGGYFLVFMFENQGVCHWLIPIRDEDDPPVLVSINDNAPRLYASSFSEFAYTCVFDSQLEAGVCEVRPELTEHSLRALQSRWPEHPRTYAWPGATNYRFGNASARITVWANPGQADWNLAAHTDSDVQQLIDRICDIW